VASALLANFGQLALKSPSQRASSKLST